MSTSTGAPAALARSEGAMLVRNGTATPTVPTAPAAQVRPIAVRRAESRGLGESLMTSLLEMVSGGIEKPLILAYCGATIKGAGGGGATAPARRLRWRLRRSFATVPPRVRDDAEAAVLRWRGGWAAGCADCDPRQQRTPGEAAWA